MAPEWALFLLKGFTMQRLYIIIAICGIIIGIYFFGTLHGRDSCIKQIATENAAILQQQNIEKEKINAEIYRTDINTIRNILRTKYTIADHQKLPM